MTRLWLTCFSAAICLVPLSGAAASVSGVVQLSTSSRSLGERTRALEDIVVWLEPLDDTASLGTQPQHARMLQKDKMFHPHILPVTVGTTVEFPNADPIFHNAFSKYDGQLFDVALYPPGTSRSVVFRKPGVVRVFCNIHASMAAIIVVLKTHYFAKVNADRSYRILNVPPGQYVLSFFDERATRGQNTVPLTVEAGASEARAPLLQISEVGYVTAPHKNKYGRNYSPDADTYGANGPPK
jgi:plastocyanin